MTDCEFVTPPKSIDLMEEASIGELHLAEDGETVFGWSFNAATPKDRQTVEIFAGDTMVVAIVAARYVPELDEQGIGDGRYGFRYKLSSLTTHPVISARSRRSGLIFGRLVRAGNAAADEQMSIIPQLAAGLEQMELAASAIPSRHSAGTLATAAKDFAARLEARARRARGQSQEGQSQAFEGSIAVSIERLSRHFGYQRLTSPAQPKLTFVLTTGEDVLGTGRQIAALARLLKDLSAELLLVDNGKVAACSLLPAAFPGLRYIFDPTACTEAAAMNSAGFEAQSPYLVCFAAGQQQRSVRALNFLFDALQSAPDNIIFNRAAFAFAEILSPDIVHEDRPVFHSPTSLGLFAAMETARFIELGGFDVDMIHDSIVAAADFLLRAATIGLKFSVWDERPACGLSKDHDKDTKVVKGIDSYTAVLTRWR